MQKSELAKTVFCEGCNCCQAVVLAFAEEIGTDKEMLAHLASSFGAGMGGLQEVCGAVTGMFMVLGAKYGYGHPVSQQEKTEHAARIREAAEAFKEKFGSLICRELKFGDRDRDFCATLVQYATELTEAFSAK
ncbi:MAG: C_GCAxxG_C_C family protein [Ruminococcaceae bacterium]|nr:C_GCAxxG_C_C family protein [Oscillospiraceae bacterium]